MKPIQQYKRNIAKNPLPDISGYKFAQVLSKARYGKSYGYISVNFANSKKYIGEVDEHFNSSIFRVRFLNNSNLVFMNNKSSASMHNICFSKLKSEVGEKNETNSVLVYINRHYTTIPLNSYTALVEYRHSLTPLSIYKRRIL